MYSIGEFSRLSVLTVKTLRHYHEKGLLIPSVIDERSGYRLYDRANLERARIIVVLKKLEFSLDDIAQILEECGDDGDVVSFLEKQKQVIETKLERYRDIKNTLESVVAKEREAKKTMNNTFQIEEKTLAPQLIAGIRKKGRYDDCGDRFKKLGRLYGFGIAGKAGNLIYDEEYKEEDADFESYFPVKKKMESPDIKVHTLPETRVLALIHEGDYDRLHATYACLLDEINRRGLRPLVPSREIYIKGPGMIFKGNPKNYVTEIQIPVAPRDP